MLTNKLMKSFEEICTEGLLLTTQAIADADLLLGLGEEEMERRGVYKQDIKDVITLAKSVKTTYVYALNSLHKEEPDIVEFISLLQQAVELESLLERTLKAVDDSIKEDFDEEEEYDHSNERCHTCGIGSCDDCDDSSEDDKFKGLPEGAKEYINRLINGLGISAKNIKIVNIPIRDKEE